MSPRRRPPKRGAEFFAEHSARFFAATSPAEAGIARLDLALALCRDLAERAEKSSRKRPSRVSPEELAALLALLKAMGGDALGESAGVAPEITAKLSPPDAMSALAESLPSIERSVAAAREAALAGELGIAFAVCAHYFALYIRTLDRATAGMLAAMGGSTPAKPGSNPRGRPEGPAGKLDDPEEVGRELSRLRGAKGKRET